MSDHVQFRYKIVRLIEIGGEAAVFKVEDWKYNKTLRALKVYSEKPGDAVVAEVADPMDMPQ